MTIKLLDESTISKIAAGEIIENPASIVKELVENSIDAESDNIVIELRGESTNYIKITDNGTGFNEDDLEIAFLRHSTSKLNTIDDLQKIRTLGFRGEALSSIANISKIKLMTKSDSDVAGTSILVENGKIIKKNKIGMPKGTTFIITDIFYNTPVRKKFLKKDKTEINNIIDLVQKIALSNTSVKFTLIKDGKTVLDTNSDSNVINRIYSVLGSEIASSLNAGKFKSETYNIKGYFSNNKLFRSNRDSQYIFINGRYIKNLNISRAIESKYHSLIPLNRYPCFVLYIEIDPSLIDVNIHPKKNEVKISEEKMLLAILSEIVEEVIYPNRSIRNIDIPEEKSVLNVFDMFNEENNDKNEENKENQVIKNNDLSSLNNIYEDSSLYSSTVDKKDNSYREDTSPHNNIDLLNDNEIELYEDFNFINSTTESKIDERLLNTRIVGVVFKTYILLENQKDSICYIVDQHAAHERVNYEKYLNMYLNKNINSQILLKPEIIELNQVEYDRLQNYLEIFQQLGFKIDDFGDNSIVLREVPIIFGMPTYVDFIRDIIDSLDKNITSNYEANLYKIMKKACKASVKSGDKLSNIEIEELIKNLKNCDNPYTCPHGRPTIIEISLSTIAKLFLRE